MIIVDHSDMLKYSATLCDRAAPIAERVDALFCLRSFEELEAIDELIKAFEVEQESDLLKHEICYCLGQMNNSEKHNEKIQKFLEGIVEGDYTHIIVHEAVEALGNINDKSTLQLLEKYRGSGKCVAEIVEETVEVSEALLQWNLSTDNGKTEGLDKIKPRFHTNDPAPSFNYVADKKYADIGYLTKLLLDDKVTMFDRYRALFTLRNIYTKESCEAMCQTLTLENFKNCSALLKHEVAFVLAQMDKVFHVAVPYLLEACKNPEEAPIVKHEGLVAIGEMIDDPEMIRDLLNDPDPIVWQSCAVALNNLKNRHAEMEELRERMKKEAEASNL